MTSPTDPPPSPEGETYAGHSKLASAIERGIFAGRWLLAPMYLGLAVSLLLLLGKFVQETVELARHTGTARREIPRRRSLPTFAPVACAPSRKQPSSRAPRHFLAIH
jgi:hypothetical protein